MPQLAAEAQRPAFADRPAERRTVSASRIEPPASTHVLQAGSIIPAALITGIRSDLPGQVTAQVTEPVYDSVTGRILLIPQGSRLIGDYNADVSFGQRRVCQAPGCQVQLSTYNPAQRCSTHDGWDRQPRSRPRRH